MKSFNLSGEQENNFSETIRSIAEQLTFSFKDTWGTELKQKLLSIAKELDCTYVSKPVFSMVTQPDGTHILCKDNGYVHVLWYDYSIMKPPVDRNVLAYHPEWKDFLNPEGIRIGTLNEDGEFETSGDCSNPQFWTYIPEFKE